MKLLDFIREKLTTLFAPATFKCTCCGAEIFDELGFCQECKKQVVYNNKKVCKRCGVGIDGEEDYCGNCDPVVNTGSEFMDLIFNNYQITNDLSSGSSGCEMYGWAGTPTTGGIMDHLQPGTAVDVMIVHLPSNKAIYDKTVIVQ